MVEVEVPQRAHVIRFVTANLTLLTPLGRQEFSRAFFGWSWLAQHAPGHHVPPHRGIGLQRTKLFISLHQGLQVVVVQLIGPVRVIVVLVGKTLDEIGLQGHLPAVFPHGLSQHANRIVLLSASTVEPGFNRLGREADVSPGQRMCPSLGGQGCEGGLEFSPRRGELNSEPTTEKRKRAHKSLVD